MAVVASELTSALADSPHAFLQPSLPLYTDALAYLKSALDPLAVDVSTVQQQRQHEARKKRKRGRALPDDQVLRSRQIHTAGFSVEQVWEQARRVIDAARVEAERGLEKLHSSLSGQAELRQQASKVQENGAHSDSEDDDLGEEGVDYEVEGLDDGGENFENEDEDAGEKDNIAQGVGEGEDDFDMDDEDIDNEQLGNNEPPDEFVADKFGLNDGFFSIEDFNRRSEFLEQQDFRGDDDGTASDEEDVAWDEDPLAQGGAALDHNGTAEDDEDDDEDGPTFGDPDAPSEDDDEELDAGEMDDMGGMSNTNDIMYADFFAPPAQKKRKNKKGRPNPHNFPEASANGEMADEDDVERTMAAVHRELFDDEESDQGEQKEEEEERDALDPSDPKLRRSTHERRKAALAEEIRKLEAANVAKREWTLSGEARAADRPVNSLLEEDLDFQRAGKPAPVITAEVSESIEELIKRRILAFDFQDIIRRRPDDLATGKDAKRGRLDIDIDADNKNRKGLAEEYEEEYTRRTDPSYVSAQDEKTRKEEKEISALWKKVCADLDSLSSWHFRPKAPVPQLDIRVDAPAISMEDARPSAGGEVAGASQLAPQEVYKGGQAAKVVREEVVSKGGLPAGREEMTREERKRRRRREKERIRKAGGSDAVGKPVSKAGKEKKDLVGDLKRGAVSVIGKKGDRTDVEGKEVRNTTGGQRGAGRYKL